MLFGFAEAQQITYTPMTAAGYRYKYLLADSGFALPFRDTTIGRGTDRPGSIVCRPADSLVYIWNGLIWDFLGGVSTTFVTNYVDSSIAINNYYNGIDSSTAILFPFGAVIWDSLLVFHTTEYHYKINGVRYSADAVPSITLTPANPSADRYTIFYGDTLGNIGTIDGLYSNPADIPGVDPASQILLATYLIPAGAVTPYQITNNVVYKENVEWAVTTGTGVTAARINPLYTTAPFQGTYSLFDSSVVAGTYIEFTYGSDIVSDSISLLAMQLKLLSTFNTNTRLNFTFLHNGSIVSQNSYALISGSNGFNRAVVGSYQAIGIQMNLFSFYSGVFNKIRISFTGPTNTSGIQIDNFVLIANDPNATGTGNVVNSWRGMTGPPRTGNVQAVRTDYTTFFDSIKLRATDSLYYDLYNNGVLKMSVPTLYKKLVNSATVTWDTTANGDLRATAIGGGGGGDSVIYYGLNASLDSTILEMFDGRRFAAPLGGGTGGGVSKAQLPLLINAAGDSVTRRWNVLDYLPGFVSGVTDATSGIQAAINACSAGGGGEVFFPKGRYKIAGPLGSTNSQLFVPYIPSTDTLRNSIKLIGEGLPTSTPVGSASIFHTTTKSNSTVVLISTLTSGAAGAAILGTSSAGFNSTSLSVENINFEVKNNPSGSGPVVGGINWRYGSNMYINHVFIYTDTAAYNTTFPAIEVSGIETPDDGSAEQYTIQNTTALGFRNGFKVGEHVVLNQVAAFGCYRGYHFKFGNHTLTGERVLAQQCAYDLYFSGALTISNFNLDGEWLNQGKWYDNIATIKDTANIAYGQVFYTIIEGFVGKNNSKFSISGGANLHYLSHDLGVASPVRIGDPIINATVNGVFYAGTNGKLRESDSYFVYDSTNKRLGVGVGTPQNTIDATATNPFLRLNTTSANTTQSGIVYTRNSTPKWLLEMNAFGGSTDDFQLLDGVNSKAVIYANGSGALNLGGTATANSAAAITIGSTNNVGFDNSAFLWNSTNHNLTITTASGNHTLKLNGNTTSDPQFQVGGQVIQSYSDRNAFVANNAYFNGSNYKYLTTGEAAQFQFTDGVIYFKSAPSGSAGANATMTANITVANNGAIAFNTYTAGTLVTDGSGNITASSDRRIKNSINDFNYGLAAIMKLKPSTFIYNADKSNTVMNGFIAQDVQKVIPTAVHAANDKIGTLSLETNAILATLVNAVKEQQAQIEDLKKQIKALTIIK